MKKVVEASQVCHLWANKSQDQARTPSDNLYFYGPTLFSYGSHFVIAHHLDNGGILWNESGYSNTTAKHKSKAWQALAGWQRGESLVFVPSLNRSDVDELERIRRDGQGKVTPSLVSQLAEAIVSKVQDIAGMREGKGPESGAFHAIKQWEKAGQALCAYVAKGKRAPKWPLPALPATMPTGDERKAWIKSVAKGKLLATHDASLMQALQRLDEMAQHIAEGAEVDNWKIQNFRGTLDGIARSLNDAGRAYEVATGKKSAKVRNAWKKHEAASAQALPMVEAWEDKRARYALRSLTVDAYRALHARRMDRPTGSRRGLSYVLSKMEEASNALREVPETTHQLMQRVKRVCEYVEAQTALEAARARFEAAMSYLPQHPGDAARHFRSAQQSADLARRSHAAFAAQHDEEISQIILQGQSLLVQAKEAAARAHLAKIDAWKEGENVSIPYDAGTFARIKGNIVQTSRGASVPLSHACRLARIARRVIAHGGKTWEHGQGPRVGGFMVRSIGADGSAVIGCHEFDGAESLRMLALLDACPECANVTDEGTE